MQFDYTRISLLLIPLIIGLYWLMSRHQPPVFTPIPTEHRTAFELDLSFPTLEGKSFHLAALRGHVVLLNIWATWCYPCRAEMPALTALYHRYRSAPHFAMIAVATDPQGREVVAPFVKTHQLPFHILLDVDDALTKRLDLPGIPTTYLLDRQGRIVLREVGQRDWNHPDMHQLLDALLALAQETS